MPTKAPLEQFLEKALQEFERERQRAGLAPAAIDLRMRGARQSSHSSSVNRRQRANT